MTQPSHRTFYPLWFVSLSLLLIVILLPLSRQGMFLDGVIYAAIAKNMSMGHGHLWQPFYSQTHFPQFYEHPPLALYFQSLFFKLFGQGYGVERLYSLLMALGQFALISWYWLKNKNNRLISLGLLLLLWLLIPLNHLYVSNMLESSLTLFTTFASILLLGSSHSHVGAISRHFFSAAAMLAAFFCNGPSAFFPLVIPFLRNGKFFTGLKQTLALIMLLSVFFLVFFWWFPEALFNTEQYFKQQLLAAVIGMRQLNYTGFGHLHVIALYLRAYWLVTCFAVGAIALASHLKKQRFISELTTYLHNRPFIICLVLSLAASLPVGISHRQAFNYLMQSAPFFTLAMMFLCYQSVSYIAVYCQTRSRYFETLYRISFLLFASCFFLFLSLANGFNRHQSLLKDIHYLSRYCQNDEVLSISPALYYQWYTGAYLARQSMISVTPELGNRYYLGLSKEPVPKNYHALNLPLSYYQLAIHS